MTIAVYESDQTTPLTAAAIENFLAGASSDPIEFWVANEGVEDIAECILIVESENPISGGVYVKEGVPPQDEGWPRVRAIGQDDSGDSTAEQFLSPWTVVGSYRGLLLPDIKAGNMRQFELEFKPPSNGSPAFYRFGISLLTAINSIAIPAGLGEALPGILDGVGDSSAWGVISGGEVTANSPADDEVDVAPVQYVARGVEFTITTETTQQLNQDDVNTEALQAGESYYAVAGVDETGVVWTKGARDSSPEIPAVPMDQEPLGVTVEVRYQVGGTSEIETADITQAVVYDRFKVEAGTGLAARVGKGRALGPGSFRFSQIARNVALEANETNRIWIVTSGLLDATTDETPPEDGAIGPIADAVTDGAGVTSVVDRRIYVGQESSSTVSVKTSTGSLTTEDVVLASGEITLTLPSGSTGRTITIKNIGSSTVTVDTPASETIDGDAEIELYEYDSVDLVYGGTNWFIL